MSCQELFSKDDGIECVCVCECMIYLLVCRWGNINAPWLAARLELAGECDVVSKQTVPWHLHSNHTG